mgnify:CR=1 FL=1
MLVNDHVCRLLRFLTLQRSDLSPVTVGLHDRAEVGPPVEEALDSAPVIAFALKFVLSKIVRVVSRGQNQLAVFFDLRNLRQLFLRIVCYCRLKLLKILICSIGVNRGDFEPFKSSEIRI